MNKIIKLLVVLLGYTLLLSAQEGNRGAIEGIITSTEDNQPIVGANVMLQGTVLGTTSDANGKFVLPKVPVGNYTLIVSIIGFTKGELMATVKVGEVSHLSVKLEPSAIQRPPIIITANKREQSLQEIPVSVSVIDDKILSNRNSITVDDALRYVPGVSLNRSQINIRGSTGYSHGVGSRVLLLIDGLPFLSGDTEEIIWESIPTAEIERIEVVKGAGSALYGSSALGGVINIITKSVQEEPETKIKFYSGLYDKPKYSIWQWTDNSRTFGGLSASHRQRIGDVGLDVGISRTLDDGYKRNDYWKRWNTWARIGYNISPYQSATISFSLLDQRRGNFLWWKDVDHALEPPDDQLTQQVQSLRWNLGGSYKQFLTNDFYYTFKLNWYRSRWEDNIPSGTYLGTASRSDFVVGELQTNYQISERHIITGGISTNINKVSAESIFGNHSAYGGALYGQDEIKLLESLRLTLGGRFDYQKQKESQSISQFNPKFGVVYNPNSIVTMRGSIGRAFRAPSVAELFTKSQAGGLPVSPNENLKPERSWSFELGGTLTPFDFLSVDIAGFRNEFWDLIEPTFTGSVIQFQNITRARISGTEISLLISSLDRIFQSQISYTYVYPQDVTTKQILEHRQQHLLYLKNQLNLGPVELGFDFRYVSKIEKVNSLLLLTVKDGDKRVPMYIADLHLRMDWKFSGAPIVSAFHINNLFQYYYTDFIGSIAPLRNYVLTIETTL